MDAKKHNAGFLGGQKEEFLSLKGVALTIQEIRKVRLA